MYLLFVDQDAWKSFQTLQGQHHHLLCGNKLVVETFQPDSLLCESLRSTVLRPTCIHLMCVSGVVQTRLFLFLQAVNNNGVMGIFTGIQGIMDFSLFKISECTQFIPAKKGKELQRGSDFQPILLHFIQESILRTGVCVEERKALLAVLK